MKADEAIAILNGAQAMVLNRNPDKFVEAVNRAILALDRERQRYNPKPLTVEVLKLMEGEPVYVVPVKPWREDLPGWCVLFDGYACVPGQEWAWDFYEYGKTWLAYRNKPKEE